MPNFVQLHSLSDVQRYAERTAPWRGRPGLREWPLTKNRRTGNQDLIRSERDHNGPCWHMQMYSTNVVTYYDDGRITLNPYNSKTTVEFANEVAPVRALLHRDVMYFVVKLADGQTHYLRNKTTIRPTGDGRYELVSGYPPPASGTERRLDEEGVAALRQTKWFKDLRQQHLVLSTMEDSKANKLWVHLEVIAALTPDTAPANTTRALQTLCSHGWTWNDVRIAMYHNLKLIQTVDVPSTRLPQRTAWK